MGFVDNYNNKYQSGGLQHLCARHIRSEVGELVFSDYFKFTIVRNPWDKAVSQFVYMSKREDLRYLIGMRQGDSFKRYLELISKKKHIQWEPQVSFVRSQDGDCMVDFVGRFETFSESVLQIMARLGICVTQIPHEVKSLRIAYQDYFDSESKELVADLYAEDVKAFEYSY
jgi:hypothetical protein